MAQATITPTLRGDTFASTFTEVAHSNTLGLRNDEQLRLFHLSIQNNRFDHTALVKFLKRNVGRYVFSRAEYEGYKQRDDLEEVALDAVNRMRSQQDGMGLGEILLYVLLEQILEAPKVMSKIELNQARGQIHSRCDAIHLLTPDGQRTTSSIVFGTSSVVGNIGDAITAAFDRVVDIEQNRSDEVQLAEQTVFTKTLDPATANYVKDLLIPKPGGAPVCSIPLIRCSWATTSVSIRRTMATSNIGLRSIRKCREISPRTPKSSPTKSTPETSITTRSTFTLCLSTK